MHDLYYPVGNGIATGMRLDERRFSVACTQFIDEVSASFKQGFNVDPDGSALSGIKIENLFESIRNERSDSLLNTEESEVIATFTDRRDQLSGKIGEVLARSDLVGFSVPRMSPVWVGRIAAQEPLYETAFTSTGVYVAMSLPIRDVYGGSSHAELKYFGNRPSVSEPYDLDITAYGFIVAHTGLVPKRNYWPQLSVGWDAIDKISMNGMISKIDRKHYIAARRFVKRTYTANPIRLENEQQ